MQASTHKHYLKSIYHTMLEANLRQWQLDLLYEYNNFYDLTIYYYDNLITTITTATNNNLSTLKYYY